MRAGSRFGKQHSIAAALLLCAPLLFACGNEIGDRCDAPGSTADCEGYAVCTNDSGGGASCRLICTDQSQCPPGWNCNGVTGSTIKSCQPG